MRAVQAHKRGQFVMWGYAPHAQTYQRGGILFEITSGTVKFAKYFEEWNASFILGGNDIKLCFYRI